MKKILIFAAVLVGISMAACQNAGSASNDNQSDVDSVLVDSVATDTVA